MFKTIFIEPLYNLLVFLINVVPWHDVGLAIIIMTILVKFVLAPLHSKAITGQFRMKQLEPKIKEIKKNYPDKQAQAAKTFELYKEYKISPLSGCLPILIQLPIILALYRVFLAGFNFDTFSLYSFVHQPETIRLVFLGFVDLTKKSIGFALLAGFTQFLQAHYSAQRNNVEVDPNDKSLQANMTNMMGKQMKYFLPIFVAFISYQISAAIALYWSVNNIFTTVQEMIIHRRINKTPLVTVVDNKKLN
jgi:YidC/Oxa1 family membrane protein insertase